MHFDIAWQEVDTVLLDMDGTLLDLAFDNYFWQTLVPETWGAARGLNLQEAKEAMRQEYHAVQHTLNWYCLDYWSERLGLDICAMTSEQGPRATLREDTVPFLDALKACGKRRILLTNAHPHNLAVKLKHTGLDAHLDLLLSTHTFGYPKRISVCGAPWRRKLALRRTKRCLSTTARRYWMPRGSLAFVTAWVLPILTPDWRKSSICAIRG